MEAFFLFFFNQDRTTLRSRKSKELEQTQLFTASTNGRHRYSSHLSSCCLQAIRWTRELNLKTLAKPDGMLPQYTVYCNPLPPVILYNVTFLEIWTFFQSVWEEKKSAFLARVMSWMNLNMLPCVLWLKWFAVIFPEVGTTWKNNITKLLYFL